MLLAKNRKATYNYEIVDKYMAGMQLKGYEVKAIKEGKANLEGSYIKILDDEAYVVGLSIARYSKQSQKLAEDDTKRDRKLLLNKNEIGAIAKELNQKGKTAVALALLLRNNTVKLELAVVKGRKKEGKKALAKEKQVAKDLGKQKKQLGL